MNNDPIIVKNKKEYKFCIICNKQYHRPYPRTQQQWDKRRFCSRECFYKWNRQKNHATFKGKIVSSNGYILIYKPEHHLADRNGYVREHRLIIEEKIGRLLNSYERIHHLNGNKTDNRPKNLKLFSSEKEHQQKTHSNYPNFKYSGREKEYHREYMRNWIKNKRRITNAMSYV